MHAVALRHSKQALSKLCMDSSDGEATKFNFESCDQAPARHSRSALSDALSGHLQSCSNHLCKLVYLHIQPKSSAERVPRKHSMEDISASADGLIISLRRADADLSAVMHRLESEFQHRFREEVLPLTIDERETFLYQMVR